MLSTLALTQIATLVATGIAVYFLDKYASKKVKLEVGGYVEMRSPALLKWILYLFLGFGILGFVYGLFAKALFFAVLYLILIIILGFLFYLSKQVIRFNAQQLIFTRFGHPTTILQWKEIESARISIVMPTLVLSGKAGSIRIPQGLSGYGQFVEMAKEKIPHLVKDLNYPGFD